MSTKSILLIEHEATLAEILRVCLYDLGGWQVTLSHSLQEGVNLCEATVPDAILLDASAAGTDAILFVEQLKHHSITRSIPILLITARANWFTLEELSQMGFAGAIAKPFNPSALSTQISHLLGWDDRS